MKLSEERSGLCWLCIGQESCMYCDMCVCVCARSVAKSWFLSFKPSIVCSFLQRVGRQTPLAFTPQVFSCKANSFGEKKIGMAETWFRK